VPLISRSTSTALARREATLGQLAAKAAEQNCLSAVNPLKYLRAQRRHPYHRKLED
jgi:hypothetical protein